MAWAGFTGGCFSGGGRFSSCRFAPRHGWPPAAPVTPNASAFLPLPPALFFFLLRAGNRHGIRINVRPYWQKKKKSIGFSSVSQRPASCCNISLCTCTPAHVSGRGQITLPWNKSRPACLNCSIKTIFAFDSKEGRERRAAEGRRASVWDGDGLLFCLDFL